MAIIAIILIGLGQLSAGEVRAGAARPEVIRPVGTTAQAGRLPDNLPAKEILLDRELSLEQLARRYFPGPLRQERFMRWVVEANPLVFVGAVDLRQHRLPAGLALSVPKGVPPRRPGDHHNGSSPLAELTARKATTPAASPGIGITASAAVHGAEEGVQKGIMAALLSPQPLTVPEKGGVERQHWLPAFAALFCGALGIALFRIHRSRTMLRRREDEAIVAAKSASRPVIVPLQAMTLPSCEWDIMPDARCNGDYTPAMPSHGCARQGWTSPAPEFSFRPQRECAERGTPAMIAIELANVLSAMGLANSAARTLAGHLTDNPREALKHWLTLLELYRSNGGYAEQFARSADQLRQYFNVCVEACQQAGDGATAVSLENYLHVRNQLVRLWGKPQCLPFLQSLLVGNRGGTRIGFPLSVAEEILVLIAIQDEVPCQREELRAGRVRKSA